ncbi:sugar phosphate isomerase/epimerase [Sodalis sp. dw_96]|uniref:sugar phosphate isomerase/epimerase family protein n=1 Tax=Sodalis sp. dw_96 TaxID=2719794 RepID=UPI001BD4E7C2|nr:sugar phosphate isomerase/epimerase [Sodalis sp. dw_96]
MKHAIFVVTAAYGNGNVLTLGGQHSLLPIIARSGAAGVEIRRELLTKTDLKRLPALHQAISGYSLRCFYSAPEALFTPDGSLNTLLPRLFTEANQLGAERLKLSLGRYSTAADLAPLDSFLAGQQVALTVENDQTECGTLAPLMSFFHQVKVEGLPITMTFDIGNWHWVGQEALEAAGHLAAHVGYIHVKTAVKDAAGWRAVPPDAGEDGWRQLLAALPGNVPRGIEFPLEGEDLTAVTRRFVSLLQ